MRPRGWKRAPAKAAVALAALLLSAQCRTETTGPPAIVLDRTACSHCSMLISDPIFAVARRMPDGGERTYDDVACLRADLGTASAAAIGDVWFHDSRTGAWLDGRRVMFVQSGALHSPMGGGTIAVDDPAEAARLAADHRGRVIPSLDMLVGQAEGGRP